jgi:hypothetical protein
MAFEQTLLIHNTPVNLFCLYDETDTMFVLSDEEGNRNETKRVFEE